MLTALLLPPAPLLLLLLIGARLLLPRRGLGWLVILTSATLLWLSCCNGTAQLLSQFALRPPAALTLDRIKELKAESKGTTAILALGGGLEPYAPEYGAGNLRFYSLERLRYALWLSRETGLPVGFSGGVGWGQPDATPEARIASQIASAEFGRPLKWIEENSRDTRENAALSIAMMKKTGVTRIVLVTHGWHMPRALRNFEAAAEGTVQIEAAPMGLAKHVDRSALDWLPTSSGMTDVRNVLRELVGRWAGA